MKKRLSIVLHLFIVLSPLSLIAQLVNDGATIVITSNTHVHVDSSVMNNSGVFNLQEDATLHIGVDLINDPTAVFDAHINSLVSCFGDDLGHLDMAGDSLGKLEMAKGTGIDVLLSDDLFIKTALIFDVNDNRLQLDDHDLRLAINAIASGYSSMRYVEADSTGKMIKRWNALGSFEYPIGDDNEYSPIEINITEASFGSAASIGLNLQDLTHPEIPVEADASISRYWTIENTDITGLEATAMGTYVDADIDGIETDISGAGYIVDDWNYSGAMLDDMTNTLTMNLTEVMDLTGTNFFGRLSSLKAFLKGPYGGGQMNTALRDQDYIPLSTPYGTGETVNTIPVDVTDWVKIEIRDVNDSTIVLKSYSVFISKTGQLVDTMGNDTIWLKDAPSEGFISIRHRNHLGIMTPSSIDITSYGEHDFTTGSGQAYGADPMQSLGSGVWGMWSGNANGNGNIRYNGSQNDKVKVLIKVGTSTPNDQVLGYNREDVNMDGKVRYNGSQNDKVKILINVGTSTPNNIIQEQLP